MPVILTEALAHRWCQAPEHPRNRVLGTHRVRVGRSVAGCDGVARGAQRSTTPGARPPTRSDERMRMDAALLKVRSSEGCGSPCRPAHGD
jgi:hypothetical protein